MESVIIYMKQLCFTLLLLCCIIRTGTAQPQNGSFEQWANIGRWYENPDFWTTNNLHITAPVVRDSDYYNGSWSMRLNAYGEARQMIRSLFPTHQVAVNNTFTEPFDLSAAPKGSYFAAIRVDGAQVVRKVTVK